MSDTVGGAFDRLKAVDGLYSKIVGQLVMFTDNGCHMQVAVMGFGSDADDRKAREEAFAAELVKRWNAGAPA